MTLVESHDRYHHSGPSAHRPEAAMDINPLNRISGEHNMNVSPFSSNDLGVSNFTSRVRKDNKINRGPEFSESNGEPSFSWEMSEDGMSVNFGKGSIDATLLQYAIENRFHPDDLMNVYRRLADQGADDLPDGGCANTGTEIYRGGQGAPWAPRRLTEEEAELLQRLSEVAAERRSARGRRFRF